MIHQYRNNGYNIVMDVYSGSVHVVDDVCYDVIAEVNKSETEPTAESLKEADVKEKLLQTLGNKYETSDIEDALSDVIELTEEQQQDLYTMQLKDDPHILKAFERLGIDPGVMEGGYAELDPNYNGSSSSASSESSASESSAA